MTIDGYEAILNNKNGIFKNRVYKTILSESNNIRQHLSSNFRALINSLVLSNICLIDIYQMWEFVYTMEFPKEISVINSYIGFYDKIVYPRVFNDKKYNLSLIASKY